MQPYQQRVVEEKSELDKKIKALNTFIMTTNFSTLDPKEQDRLLGQVSAMEIYTAILGERIAAFT